MIGDIKLKIVLDRENCLKYGIETDDGEISENNIRPIIRELLELAKERCGFECEGEKILAQLYPTPDGGCEIFVTRLTGVRRQVSEAVKDVQGMSTIEEKRGTYSFPNSEILLRAAQAIYREGIDCDLYLSDNGVYYISIREDFLNGLSEFEILTEYGERHKTFPLCIIAERGTLLCKEKALDYILHRNL